MARLSVAQIGSQQIAELFGVGDAPTSPIPSEMTEGLEGRSSSRITGTDC
jgi:hypothetical protein